jgi:hypothetical protein
LVIGAFVRGLSMRGVESLCEQAGLGRLSRSTASRICAQLRYEQFKRRDLRDSAGGAVPRRSDRERSAHREGCHLEQLSHLLRAGAVCVAGSDTPSAKGASERYCREPLELARASAPNIAGEAGAAAVWVFRSAAYKRACGVRKSTMRCDGWAQRCVCITSGRRSTVIAARDWPAAWAGAWG